MLFAILVSRVIIPQNSVDLFVFCDILVCCCFFVVRIFVIVVIVNIDNRLPNGWGVS